MQDEPRHALLAREAAMLSTGGCGLQRDPRRAGARGPAPGTQFPPPGTQFPPPRITCGTRQGGGLLPTRDGGPLRASALPPVPDGAGWGQGAGRFMELAHR